jgi:transcriptional regulator with XRE-family HTH domain
METLSTKSGRTRTDELLGARIRRRRRELQMSQHVLAAAISVSFQQVQKYERAASRVSASTLLRIAEALGTDVQYYYQDLPGALGSSPLTPTSEAAQEMQRLETAFAGLPAPVRRQVLALAECLAGLPMGGNDPSQ